MSEQASHQLISCVYHNYYFELFVLYVLSLWLKIQSLVVLSHFISFSPSLALALSVYYYLSFMHVLSSCSVYHVYCCTACEDK